MIDLNEDWKLTYNFNLALDVNLLIISCKHCSFYYRFHIENDLWWPQDERHFCSQNDKEYWDHRYIGEDTRQKIETYRKTILFDKKFKDLTI